MALAGKVIGCISAIWPVIILFWIGVLTFGAIKGPSLLLHTDNTVPETAGTQSAAANHAMNSAFDLAQYTPWIMYVECPENKVTGTVGCQGADGSVVICEDTQNMLKQMTQYLQDEHADVFDFTSTMSYFIVPDKLKPNFLAPNGRSTIIQWPAKRDVVQSLRFEAYETIEKRLPQLKKQYCPDCYVGVTGGDPLTREVSHSLAAMLLKSEAVIIPITILIFLYMVNWNWRLAIITGFQLAAAILGAFGVSEVLADHTTRPQSITPQMIEVISMAISLDYSLFTFTRFQEELRVKRKRYAIRRQNYIQSTTGDFKQSSDTFLPPTTTPIVGQDYFGLVYDAGVDSPYDPQPHQSAGVAKLILNSALITTLEGSGHVVLCSGGTLLLSFSGFFLSRCSFLIQPAVMTGIGVFFSILTALSLPYACIAAAPSFFTDSNFFPKWVYTCCCKNRRVPQMFDTDFTGDEVISEDPFNAHDDLAYNAAQHYSTAPNRMQSHSSFALENQTNAYPSAIDDNSQNMFLNTTRGGKKAATNDRSALLKRGAVTSGGSAGYDTLDGNAAQPTHAQLVYRDQQYESATHVDMKKFHNSWSYKFGRYLVRFPFNIIVMLIVFAALGYFASHLKDLSLSSAYQLGLPRNGDTVITLQRLQQGFPPGVVAPFYFVLTWTPTEDIPSPGAMFQDMFFQVGHDVLTTMDAASNGVVKANYTQSPFYFDDKYITTGAEAQSHLLDLSYLAVWSKTVSPSTARATKAGETMSMLITLFAPYPPDHPSVVTWIYDARKNVVGALNEKYKASGVEIFLSGYKCQEQDTIDKTDDTYPLMLSTTFLVVIIFVSIVLKSAFVPVRLVLTLALPIAAVFGATVMVYQKDVLRWMNLSPFMSHNDIPQIYWELIPFCAVVLLSLALDYDIFILSRIIEFRTAGYDSQSSILLGLYTSSGVISAAGILMALSFSPLFMLQSQACAELGFLLVVGVLVDTYIIRPVLLPCIFSFGDRIAWWPRKLKTSGLRSYDGTIVN